MKRLALVAIAAALTGCCIVRVPVACCGLAVDLWELRRDEKARAAALDKRCDEPFGTAGETLHTKGWCPK